MTISYNWLKDYLKTDLNPDQIAEILTDIGLEVDKLEKAEKIPGSLRGVVVGHVLTCGKHPDADKLKVTTVDVGESEPLQIVCGAPNVAAGQKVLVATVNTTLYPADAPEGFKIKKSKIRGVESLGMICAEDELGLGTDHDGIMVLPGEAMTGTPALDHLGLEDDWIIEIGLTPNRADATSHWGVARDLAAYMAAHDIPYKFERPSPVIPAGTAGDAVTVEVEDPQGAPRYTGLTVRGITIAPSPEWLQERLRAIGITPKNNVVDITNFILHETGQPLHAFDADKIKGNKIVVRNCPEGTRFVTLDGEERILAADDLMICNAEEPMCIAGVFGGLESGISDDTKNVFIESAYFNPSRVRRTAKRHGLNTDSSFRFERGADPEITVPALKRAVSLILETAGGTVIGDITDTYPTPVAPFRFEFRFDYLDKLAGKHIPRETVVNIIKALDIVIENETPDSVSVAVPTYRVDVTRPADLAEDILRIYGYNNIEIPTRVTASVAPVKRPDPDHVRNVISDLLSSNGFNEIMSNSLTRADYYEGLTSYPSGDCVRILNPLSNDLGVMRQTLLFNALEAVILNTNHRNPDLKLYEFGNCYFFNPEAHPENELGRYSEKMRLAVTVTGKDRPESWNVKPEKSDFFLLRGYVEKVMKRFCIDIYDLKEEAVDSDLFDEGLTLTMNGKPLASMGAVSAAIRSRFDIKAPVWFMEMEFGLLLKALRKQKVQAVELNKYPEVRRDLALLVDKATRYADLRNAAFLAERKLLKGVSLFDVYEGDKLPDGKKSYALAFTLEDRTSTLTDKVIDKVMANITRRLESDCGAEVRTA